MRMILLSPNINLFIIIRVQLREVTKVRITNPQNLLGGNPLLLSDIEIM